MIKCPRCGAEAQWGAPQCPRCFAQFVAPPTPPPPQVAPNQAIPNPGFPQPKSFRWIPAALVAGLVLVGGFWLLFKPKGNTAGGNSQGHAFALQRDPAIPDSNPSGGFFKVTPQANQAPVVDITNTSPYPLRLVLEDANGAQKIEWIAVNDSRELTIPQGSYQASIDAPDDGLNVPAYGSVDIQNFHHYDAEFGLIPYDGSPNSFHIGD
jgi:hypothetical protein